MESFLYICEYCSREYEPKRRGIQKFCSSSCRSKYHRLVKKEQDTEQQLSTVENKPVIETLPAETFEPPKQKVDQMSVAGVGNAAAGVGLIEAAKMLLTPTGEKSATKNDVNEIKSLIKGARYFPVKNMNPNQNGEYPFYDFETGEVVYLR